MDPIIVVLVALIAAAVGAGAGAALARHGGLARINAVEAAAAQRLAEVEAQQKELLLEAKEEAIRVRSAAEAEARAQRNELKVEQQRLRQKEEALDRKLEGLEQRERRLSNREQELEHRVRDVDELRAAQVRQLELVGQMTREEARDLVIARVDEEMREEAGRRARSILNQARAQADEDARRLITLAVQRLAGEHVGETTVSVVPIPNEEMKGRIIGREGRNIRALEAATGVDLIIDETPDAVMISGFDPIRREIARLALGRLVQDGRIHPARIEEVVAKVTQEVEDGMLKEGEEAALACGVHGLHPEILRALGRLKYRTSYGQNQLMHSIEAAQIARILANELGADAEVATRTTLLQDIGKALGHEVDGPHYVIGADFVRRFGESRRVADAIAEHHAPTTESMTVEAVIAQAAHAISGARPGARHEGVEHFIKRLEALEQVANSFEGVERSFAVQAGREVRIIVRPDQIDDLGSIRLARDIAKKIEESLQYAGQVRVTVVRETRAFEIAH